MSAPSSSSAHSSAAALQVTLAHLQGALTYTEQTNIETNKKLWNEYAKNYAAQQQKAAAASSAASSASAPSEWVLDMASHVHRNAAQLEFLGDEWSDDASLTQSLNQFLLPYLGVDSMSEEEWAEAKQTEERILATGTGVSHLPPSHLRSWIAAASSSSSSPARGLVVAELGVGGGRIASRVYPHVQRLYCFDIAAEMLEQAQASISRQWKRQQAAAATANNDAATAVTPAASSTAVAADSGSSATPAAASLSALSLPPPVSLHLLTAAPSFPSKYHGTCDVVYCFDVMPHVDLHTINGYFESIRHMLKPNPPPEERNAVRPRVFLHTANLCAPLGWERFSKQTRYTAGGFYFLSPDIVRQLALKHGYRIIQESQWTSAYSAPQSGVSAATLPRESNLYYQRDYLFVMERR